MRYWSSKSYFSATATFASGLTLTGGVITNVAGSATAPSYTFSGSLGTGMYSPAANQVSFTANGVEVARAVTQFRVMSEVAVFRSGVGTGLGDTTNVEMLDFIWGGTDARIQTHDEGTGVARPIVFGRYNVATFTEWARINTAGQLSLTLAGAQYSITQGSLTTSTPAFTHTATWNAGGTTFINFDSQITDTASAAGSLAFRIRGGAAGATVLAQVDKAGVLTLGTALAVGQGGTGLTVGTSGGIPYFNATTTMASSALLTANALMLGGGAGTSPTVVGSLGATTTLLHGNAAGAPTFSAVALATDVSGTLSVANGGTGATTFTANGILYGNTAGAILVTAQGAANTILTANAGAPLFSATPTIGTSLTIAGATNQIILGTTNTVTLTSPAPAASRTITIPVVLQAETLAIKPQTSQTNPANPAGTASAPGVMMGLAGSITPQVTGKISVAITGTIYNATAIGDGSNVQIRYGTGAAPANGAALAGTTAGGLVQFVAATTATKVPFALNAIISGLTTGTAYWLDTGLAATTGGTANISDISLTAFEL